MKHLLLFLATLFSFNPLTSQNFTPDNIILFPGEYNSHETFHIDLQGNQFVAGRATGAIDLDFGSETNALPETSLKDLYIVKYDVNGNFNWLVSFDGTATNNRIFSLVSDDDGNLYVGGAFSESLQLSPDGQNEITSFGSQSMFAAKFDSDGNLLWQFSVGDPNLLQYPGNMFIRDDQLIIHLNFDGTFDVDPGPDTTMIEGDSNAMLVFDLDGTFIDAYSYRGGTTVSSSVMDEEGNLYLSGQFSGLVSLDFKTNASIISNGPFDAFVAKYDKEFNLIWTKRVGKSQANLIFSQIALDSNDDVIANGILAPEITIGANETENEANYMVKISKEGAYTGLTEILPRLAQITKFKINSEDLIILTANFETTIDIDPSDGVYEVSPMGEVNILLAVYDADFTLLDNDQIYAEDFNTCGIFLNDSNNLFILTDFVGQSKCVFGSTDIYTAENEQNFVFYKLDIDGCSATEELVIVESCDVVMVNSETYTTSGEYQQILLNAEGCDSVLNISVTLFPEYQSSADVESCGPFEFEGVVYSVSGAYTFELSTIDGCDSIVVLNLVVTEIDKSLSINEEQIIATEEEGNSYQWYDCNTNLAIENETARIFTPEEDGSYRVEIVKGSCVENSDCIEFNLVGTREFDFVIQVSPNPTQGIIYLQVDHLISEYTISLFDLTGKEVVGYFDLNPEGILDLSELNSGIYILKLKDDHHSAYKKIVKQ